MIKIFRLMQKPRIVVGFGILLLTMIAVQSCKDELEIPLQGEVSADVITFDSDWIVLQLGAAYGILDGNLDNSDPWRSAPSRWIYGEVSSDNAYKGSEFGDQGEIDNLEAYRASGSEINYYGYLWNSIFEGVARSNEAIRGIRTGLEAGDLSPEDAAQFEGEARFLRAHYHFEAKKIWRKIPFVDETVTESITNENVDSWALIEQDFPICYR